MTIEEMNVVSHPSTDPIKGDRGIVGTATAGLTIKQQWHTAKTRLSLKAFARGLVKQGDQTAVDWFEHKGGSLNEKRNDKNNARVILERMASKAARRKSGGGKGKASAAEATAVAAISGGK